MCQFCKNSTTELLLTELLAQAPNMRLLMAKSALFLKYLMDLTMEKVRFTRLLQSYYLDRPKLKLKNAIIIKEDDCS